MSEQLALDSEAADDPRLWWVLEAVDLPSSKLLALAPAGKSGPVRDVALPADRLSVAPWAGPRPPLVGRRVLLARATRRLLAVAPPPVAGPRPAFSGAPPPVGAGPGVLRLSFRSVAAGGEALHVEPRQRPEEVAAALVDALLRVRRPGRLRGLGPACDDAAACKPEGWAALGDLGVCARDPRPGAGWREEGGARCCKWLDGSARVEAVEGGWRLTLPGCEMPTASLLNRLFPSCGLAEAHGEALAILFGWREPAAAALPVVRAEAGPSLLREALW